MSYITSNVHSSGDYGTEHVFYGLPNDDSERARYRELLESIAGDRYMVVSRESREDEWDSERASDYELSVIVRPTVQYIADVLNATQVHRTVGNPARYYSETVEYYGNGVREHVPTPIPMSESYCVDVHGVSDTRLAVIETAANVKSY